MWCSRVLGGELQAEGQEQDLKLDMWVEVEDMKAAVRDETQEEMEEGDRARRLFQEVAKRRYMIE